MYYYGQNYAYPQGGYPCQTGGSSWGGVFAIVLVLFILLVIIGCGSWNNNQTNLAGC